MDRHPREYCRLNSAISICPKLPSSQVHLRCIYHHSCPNDRLMEAECDQLGHTEARLETATAEKARSDRWMLSHPRPHPLTPFAPQRPFWARMTAHARLGYRRPRRLLTRAPTLVMAAWRLHQLVHRSG